MTSARRFVILGRRATASPSFSLEDLPSTSGRLDVLIRCVRAALLVSHGLRREVTVYLVLEGGTGAPRVARIEGALARYLRPDERSLAVLLRKLLAVPSDGSRFTPLREGLTIADGGLPLVLGELGGARPFVLEQGGEDLREASLEAPDRVFFVGDHLGFDDEARRQIAATGAASIGVGPVSLHADDAIAIVSNELDRRDAAGR